MKLKGFTLAEIIVTLTIIGVVAAITIPVLNVKTEESKFIAQLGKANNTLQTSIKLAAINNDNLPIKHWETVSDATSPQTKAAALFEALTENMTTADNCASLSTCLAPTYLTLAKKTVNAAWKTNLVCTMTSDSITFCIMPDFSAIVIDLNGPQKPNTFGVDAFIFGPIDDVHNTINAKNDLATCSKDSTDATYIGSGGCAEWALKKGNMDYRRKTVNW